jgi:hypothetical protein
METSRTRTFASSSRLLSLIAPVLFAVYVNAQASNPSVVAEVFECDDNLQAIDVEFIQPRKIGHEFHICIEPNLPTRHRNVRMRAIDRFGFYKEGTSVSQVIIDNGMETDRTLTLLLCVPGSLTCSFKTKIIPELFFAPTNHSNITGIGDVTLQMTEKGYRGRQLTTILRGQVGWRGRHSPMQFDALDEVHETKHRRERAVEGDFAGQDQVKIIIPLDLTSPPRSTIFDSDDIGSSWWQEAPIWVRVVIMAIGLLLLSTMLCLVCYCSYTRLFRPTRSLKATGSSPQRTASKEVEAPFPVRTLEFTEYEETERDGTVIIPFYEEDEHPNEEENADVYFDSNEQPGTIAFYRALDKTLKTYKFVDYSPEIYRHIKTQLPGRRFYFFDFKDGDEDEKAGEWTELPKKDLVKRFRYEFEARRLENKTEGSINRSKSSRKAGKKSKKEG